MECISYVTLTFFIEGKIYEFRPYKGNNLDKNEIIKYDKSEIYSLKICINSIP